MEGEIMKFSSRVNLVCRFSDPTQPVHFLFQRYDGISGCFICGTEEFSIKPLHCDTCNFDIHRECYLQPRCRLSDLTNPHTLQKLYFLDDDDDSFSYCFACKSSSRSSRTMFYYHCPTCDVDFHEDCALYLAEITHPFHPLHPLKLTSPSGSGYSYSYLNHSINLPSSWLYERSDSETEPETSIDASISDAKCKCCQKHLQEVYYHCSICNYSLNLTCTRDPPPLTLLNLKTHDHILTFFPRRVHLPCDACGLSLDNPNDHVYTCQICNYMVHRTCIYLPRVIKITRHPHRLSFSSSSSLPSGLFLCRVCRRPINVTCGQFSCQRGCNYAVHSKCAVKGRVWDGIDLDGVPEDYDEYEDIAPFVRIDEETIQHFSHQEHYLKHHKNNNETIRDENRFCQACCVQITLSDKCFYNCIQCGFLLHEACASLPRRKDHPLHRHALILHPILSEVFKCNGCDQQGYGFVYKCIKKDCRFLLDTRCASLSDPVIHGSHPHELFFNFTLGKCMGCKSTHCSPFALECIETKSFLGLQCATLPSFVHYKHDMHPLALCYGEEEEDTTNGQSWCEICEAKLDAKKWFYKCNYCCVTVHISCLLGKERYMKPMSFKQNAYWVTVHRNNSNSRPICSKCGRRSTKPFFFKGDERFMKGFHYCSLRCFAAQWRY